MGMVGPVRSIRAFVPGAVCLEKGTYPPSGSSGGCRWSCLPGAGGWVRGQLRGFLSHGWVYIWCQPPWMSRLHSASARARAGWDTLPQLLPSPVLYS